MATSNTRVEQILAHTGAPEPDAAPVATIAWRLGHLHFHFAGGWEWTFSGRRQEPKTLVDFTPSAAVALERFWALIDRWRDDVAALTDEQLDMVGFSQYPYGSDVPAPPCACRPSVLREGVRRRPVRASWPEQSLAQHRGGPRSRHSELRCQRFDLLDRRGGGGGGGAKATTTSRSARGASARRNVTSSDLRTSLLILARRCNRGSGSQGFLTAEPVLQRPPLSRSGDGVFHHDPPLGSAAAAVVGLGVRERSSHVRSRGPARVVQLGQRLMQQLEAQHDECHDYLVDARQIVVRSGTGLTYPVARAARDESTATCRAYR